jgi:hypothetical protein
MLRSPLKSSNVLPGLVVHGIPCGLVVNSEETAGALHAEPLFLNQSSQFADRGFSQLRGVMFLSADAMRTVSWLGFQAHLKQVSDSFTRFLRALVVVLVVVQVAPLAECPQVLRIAVLGYVVQMGDGEHDTRAGNRM